MRWPGTLLLAALLLAAGCSGTGTPTSDGTAVPTTVSATPGLSPSSPPSPTATPKPPGNPWGKERIVVGIDKSAAPDRGVRSHVEAAVAWWERNTSYTTYDATFVVRPDAPDPDVVVRLVTTVGECGVESDESIVGCARLLGPGSVPADPEVVEIRASLSPRSMRRTIIHEFGHLYGLGHDAPLAVMNASAVLYEWAERDAVERVYPWRTREIDVYVDLSEVPQEDRPTVRAQLDRSLAYYDAGAEGFLAPNVSLGYAPNATAAEITVRVVGTGNTSRRESVGGFRGVDTDAVDGALEYYTGANVTVYGIPPDRVGWHVGYWLGFAFGAEDVGDLPPPFDDPESDDRTDWWE